MQKKRGLNQISDQEQYSDYEPNKMLNSENQVNQSEDKEFSLKKSANTIQEQDSGALGTLPTLQQQYFSQFQKLKGGFKEFLEMHDHKFDL